MCTIFGSQTKWPISPLTVWLPHQLSTHCPGLELQYLVRYFTQKSSIAQKTSPLCKRPFSVLCVCVENLWRCWHSQRLWLAFSLNNGLPWTTFKNIPISPEWEHQKHWSQHKIDTPKLVTEERHSFLQIFYMNRHHGLSAAHIYTMRLDLCQFEQVDLMLSFCWWRSVTYSCSIVIIMWGQEGVD